MYSAPYSQTSAVSFVTRSELRRSYMFSIECLHTSEAGFESRLKSNLLTRAHSQPISQFLSKERSKASYSLTCPGTDFALKYVVTPHRWPLVLRFWKGSIHSSMTGPVTLRSYPDVHQKLCFLLFCIPYWQLRSYLSIDI